MDRRNLRPGERTRTGRPPAIVLAKSKTQARLDQRIPNPWNLHCAACLGVPSLLIVEHRVAAIVHNPKILECVEVVGQLTQAAEKKVLQHTRTTFGQ